MLRERWEARTPQLAAVGSSCGSGIQFHRQQVLFGLLQAGDGDSFPQRAHEAHRPKDQRPVRPASVQRAPVARDIPYSVFSCHFDEPGPFAVVNLWRCYRVVVTMVSGETYDDDGARTMSRTYHFDGSCSTMAVSLLLHAGQNRCVEAVNVPSGLFLLCVLQEHRHGAARAVCRGGRKLPPLAVIPRLLGVPRGPQHVC